MNPANRPLPSAPCPLSSVVHTLGLLSSVLLPLSVFAQTEKMPTPSILGSTVFDWNALEVFPTDVGARRNVADQPSATLERFECHITTLNPGLDSHPQHQHAQEEFIILKEGVLDVIINGEATRADPGSLFFYASNDFHSVRNVGDTPATYLVFNFATAATHTAPAGRAVDTAGPDILPSQVFNWGSLEVLPNEKGARRNIFDSPTVTMANLEGHITTLNPGETPHAPHHHPDEEIIVVKEGMVEAFIDGETQTAGPGSVFFFASNDEHGLRNVGDSPATYYVFRIMTEATGI